METNYSENIDIQNLKIDENSKSYLLEYSKWAKILAIIGFIGIGLMVIGAIIFMFISGLSTLTDFKADFPVGLFGIIYGVVYLAMALLYYFPTSYLYKSATHFKSGLLNNNQEAVTSGFENLKSVFKFMGIMTIVMIGLYVLSILGMFIFMGILGATNGFNGF